MVKIEINGQIITAPEGSMLIDVADKAGIPIPRFCYHKKLSIAANCRMCLVEVENAPKPLASCATPVADGMRVQTNSPRAKAAQQSVMEFLLINHPLDCPICDQGGECELQDVAQAFGPNIGRYSESKRILPHREAGALISMDMTRCIHCTRCVRFGQEVAGMMELGTQGRSDHFEIATFVESNIESELSGNLVDVCPVGALTSKPFRYKIRSWELKAYPSVAVHDVVGSNVFAHVKDGQVYRVVPRENEALNQVWLADRDRYVAEALNNDNRLTQPMMKQNGEWKRVSWDQVLDYLAEHLTPRLAQTQWLISGNATNEEMYLANQLATESNGAIEYRLNQRDLSANVEPLLSTRLPELEKADAILVVGSHLRKHFPMINLRLNKAVSQGASVYVVNPEDWTQTHKVTAKYIGNDLGTGIDEVMTEEVKAVFKSAQSAHIFLGEQAEGDARFLDLVAKCQTLANETGAQMNVLPLAGNGKGGFVTIDRPHIINEPKAVMNLQVEPAWDAQNSSALQAKIDNAELVISATTHETDHLKAISDVLLPIGSYLETVGSHTNIFGDVQPFNAVARAPEQAKPLWKVLRVLGNVLQLDGFDYTRVDQVSDLVAAKALAAQQASADADLATLWSQLKSQPVEDGKTASKIVPVYGSDILLRQAQPLQATPDAQRVAPPVVMDSATGDVNSLNANQ